MSKTPIPAPLGPDDCRASGPNGMCRHGYPFYDCSMIVARLRERLAAAEERERGGVGGDGEGWAAVQAAGRGVPLGPLRDAIVEAAASVLITGTHVPREQVAIMDAVIDAIQRALQDAEALENI